MVFIQKISLLIKIMILSNMIIFFNEQWKGVISEKTNVFPLACSKYLSSWTGPDRSRHVPTGPDMPPGLALAGPDMSE